MCMCPVGSRRLMARTSTRGTSYILFPSQPWRASLATGEHPAPNWRRHGGTQYYSGLQLPVRVFGVCRASSKEPHIQWQSALGGPVPPATTHRGDYAPPSRLGSAHG
jgi:hypothetical protein